MCIWLGYQHRTVHGSGIIDMIWPVVPPIKYFSTLSTPALPEGGPLFLAGMFNIRFRLTTAL